MMSEHDGSWLSDLSESDRLAIYKFRTKNIGIGMFVDMAAQQLISELKYSEKEAAFAYRDYVVNTTNKPEKELGKAASDFKKSLQRAILAHGG